MKLAAQPCKVPRHVAEYLRLHANVLRKWVKELLRAVGSQSGLAVA